MKALLKGKQTKNAKHLHFCEILAENGLMMGKNFDGKCAENGPKTPEVTHREPRVPLVLFKIIWYQLV